MKSSRFRFFATANDLAILLGHLESKVDVKYAVSGGSVDGVPRYYWTYSELPNLSIAARESSVSGARYLIAMKEDAVLPFEPVPGQYNFMPSVNQIGLQTGGLWKSNILLSGEFVMGMETPESKLLFKNIKSPARKYFHVVRGNYLGPEALILLRKGYRLTSAEQSPPLYDLTEEADVAGEISNSSYTLNSMPQSRLGYEDSCRRLQSHYLDPGSIPPMADHLPQANDEEPLGISFFRTSVGDGDDLSNLTLPRTFFGRSEVNNALFRNTDLSESNLCWNDFTDVDFTNGVLAGCDLRASNYERVKFVAADLTNADMRHSWFNDCNFDDALMLGVVLTREQGEKMTLSEVQRGQISWTDDPGLEPIGG